MHFIRVRNLFSILSLLKSVFSKNYELVLNFIKCLLYISEMVIFFFFSSLDVVNNISVSQFSRSVLSDSLRLHES